MKKYENLRNACSRYPEIELHVNKKATIYNPPKQKAKNGFIENFVCDKSYKSH